MSYYFYMLRCSDGSLYCGIAKDLVARLREHNSKTSKTKYTRVKQPVKLVYSEKYTNIKLAMRRELQVKKWTKAKKEALVQGNKSILKML